MHILCDDGANHGCWGFTDEIGQVVKTQGAGDDVTAFGSNYAYQFKFDGDLMIMQWNDEGTFSDQEKGVKDCQRGTSLYMIVSDTHATATYSCLDDAFGYQMIMYRQKDADFDHLRCPLPGNDAEIHVEGP